MAKIIDDMNVYYTEIRDARQKIADLKHEKINIRAEAWKSAEGIADAKKDYVRSMVSDIDRDIDKLESDIEYFYNQIRLCEYEIEENGVVDV